MKKSNWKGFIIALVAIAVVIGIVLLVVNIVPFYFSKNNAEKVFGRNEAEFIIVAEYLSDNSHNSVSIHDNNGKVYIFDGTSGRYEDIKDQEVQRAVSNLFSRGIESIYWDGDNSINFVRWIRTRGEISAGIVYSSDDNKEPTVQYLTKLEPLSLNGWYYYEAGYNEWRVNH